jgi:hypothetical protein
MNENKVPVAAPSLRLPLQMAPVERTVVSSALAVGEGLQPSFDWGSFLQQALPVATSVLGSLF